MTATLSVTVRGEPVPWARPRFTWRGARPQSYTKCEVAIWEATIATEVLARAGRNPARGALAVELAFRFGPPSTRTLRLRPLPSSRATGDPDNLAKAVLDALNGILWVDDAQIVDLAVSKRYAARGERPGVDIRVRAAQEQPAWVS